MSANTFEEFLSNSNNVEAGVEGNGNGFGGDFGNMNNIDFTGKGQITGGGMNTNRAEVVVIGFVSPQTNAIQNQVDEKIAKSEWEEFAKTDEFKNMVGSTVDVLDKDGKPKANKDGVVERFVVDDKYGLKAYRSLLYDKFVANFNNHFGINKTGDKVKYLILKIISAKASDLSQVSLVASQTLPDNSGHIVIVDTKAYLKLCVALGITEPVAIETPTASGATIQKGKVIIKATGTEDVTAENVNKVIKLVYTDNKAIYPTPIKVSDSIPNFPDKVNVEAFTDVTLDQIVSKDTEYVKQFYNGDPTKVGKRRTIKKGDFPTEEGYKIAKLEMKPKYEQFKEVLESMNFTPDLFDNYLSNSNSSRGGKSAERVEQARIKNQQIIESLMQQKFI